MNNKRDRRQMTITRVGNLKNKTINIKSQDHKVLKIFLYKRYVNNSER